LKPQLLAILESPRERAMECGDHRRGIRWRHGGAVPGAPATAALAAQTRESRELHHLQPAAAGSGRRLEQAELQPDPVARRWLMSFVVVGGGFSGVETACELVDFLFASLKYYPGIRREELRVVLLHGTDRLLPELSPSLGEFTKRKMTMRGVQLHLQARAERVTDRAVQVSDGTLIEAGTVICTIGTASNPLLEQIPAQKVRGRLVVAPDMSVPSVEGVWALGDCAAVPNEFDGRVCPPTAQFATRQAKLLAQNIVAKLARRKTKAFRFKAVGQLSSVGHNKAVAEIFGLKLSGFIAWLLWRGVYLLKMPTLSRKTRLFLEWNWAMFFPRDISHLGFRRTRRSVRNAGAGGAGDSNAQPTRAGLRCPAEFDAERNKDTSQSGQSQC
jgi:NADH:ubiquinone reductase (H+-translocating)